METSRIEALAAALTAEAEGRSGVVLVHHHDRAVLELATGLANRADQRPMTVDTRLGTASGTKGFTALAAVSMIEEGRFGFDSRLVELVGDLPAVDPAVTVEHLLGHTSGVGDYLDEEVFDDPDDYVLDVPVHQLLGPEDFVPTLNQYPQVDPPGTRFAYNNGGYLWLALVIERLGDHDYHEEVRRRVFQPAAMAATEFLRSDLLPADAALGYLSDGRTNVLHLPVIGTGDGGAYTTGPDMLRFWDAFLAGRIVGPDLVERLTAITHHEPPESYGLGFWIGPDDNVFLEGMDAGVSLRSGVHRPSGLRYCLIANNSSDVWPLARIVQEHLDAGAD
ncbi:MAG: serine hydrolase domain-containing protein [Actinomycetota bacterium]